MKQGDTSEVHQGTQTLVGNQEHPNHKTTPERGERGSPKHKEEIKTTLKTQTEKHFKGSP